MALKAEKIHDKRGANQKNQRNIRKDTSQTSGFKVETQKNPKRLFGRKKAK